MKKSIQPHLAKIAVQARQILEKDKLYTDPYINRKKLADKLRTNEKYLADAIRSYEGTTVNDFINSFRIEHAFHLLQENQHTTVLSVAIESGFSSRITLFRLFRKFHKTSPNEFKKKQKNINQ